MVASVIGFFCYSAFALSMKVIPGIRAEYRRRHNNKENLVALNDVIFAIDAFFITSVMMIQIIIYRVRYSNDI
jgi:cystinosin